MGVQSLWSLLEICGERVNVESLSGKVVAVDASIWLQQFLKAMRDERTGDMMKNAHLLGFYRRICRLIFHGIRPVFVFDGAAPAIKQRTMNARRRRREGMDVRLKKTAEKLLLNYVKTVQVERMASRDEREQMQAAGAPAAAPVAPAGAGDDDRDRDERERIRKGKARLVEADGGDARAPAPAPAPAPAHSVASDALLAAQMSSLGGGSGPRDIDFSVGELAALSAAFAEAGERGEVFGEEPRPPPTAPGGAAGAGADAGASDRGGGDEFEDEDEDNAAELHLTPAELANLDPEAMSMLPTSMQLELMDKLREQNQAENREIFTALDHHDDFSKVQMEKFLKMSQFRKKVDDIQQGRNQHPGAEAGGGAAGAADGLVAKRIAADPKREFVFTTRLQEALPSEGIGASIAEDVGRPPPTDAKAEDGHGWDAGTPDGAGAAGDAGDCIEIDVDLPSSSGEEEDDIIEWEDAGGGGGGGRDARGPPAGRPHAGALGGASDWRERMRMRQQYFSQSHGFKFGRRLSDWDEAAGRGAVGRERARAPGPKGAGPRAGKGGPGRAPRESKPLSSFIGGSGTGARPAGGDARPGAGLASGPRAEAKRVRFALEDDESRDDEPAVRPGVGGDVDVDVDVAGGEDDDIQWEDLEEDEEDADEGAAPAAVAEEPSQPGASAPARCPGAGAAAASSVPVRDDAAAPASAAQDPFGAATPEQPVVVDAPSEERAAADAKPERAGAPHGATDDAHPIVAPPPEMVEEEEEEEEEDQEEEEEQEDQVEEDPLPLHGAVKAKVDAGPLPPVAGHAGRPGGRECARIEEESVSGVEADLGPPPGAAYRNGDAQSAEELPPAPAGEIEIPSGRDAPPAEDASAEDAPLVPRGAAGPAARQPTSTTYFPAGRYRAAEAGGDEAAARRAAEERERAARSGALRADLEGERAALTTQSRRLRAFADTPTETMYAEVQDLLTLFGIPFYVSPNEAEAQCASMEMEGVVDGVVTDDNDVFLFGARRVMRNMFDEKKFVEVYEMGAVEEKLGLNRERLILLAMMLGSDYTEGIKGVGVVNAMEILGAYGGSMDGLRRFRAFIDSPDEELLRVLRGYGEGDGGAAGAGAAAGPGAAAKAFEGKHQTVRKNWQLPESFPSQLVLDAYLSPLVDRFGGADAEAEAGAGAGAGAEAAAAEAAAKKKKRAALLAWGEPDLGGLRQLCRSKLGWDEEATAASMEMIGERHFVNRQQRQATMDQFLQFRSKFAKIRSRRIQEAVLAITGVRDGEIVLAPADPSRTAGGYRGPAKRRRAAAAGGGGGAQRAKKKAAGAGEKAAKGGRAKPSG